MKYPILQYERDADPDGDWITMAVRMKLDLAGVKLHLADWQTLDPEARRRLHEADAESPEEVVAFRECVEAELQRAGRPPAETLSPEKAEAVVLWRDADVAPEVFRESIDDAECVWAGLDAFARYVAFALSRKGDVPRLRAAIAELTTKPPAKRRDR